MSNEIHFIIAFTRDHCLLCSYIISKWILQKYYIIVYAKIQRLCDDIDRQIKITNAQMRGNEIVKSVPQVTNASVNVTIRTPYEGKEPSTMIMLALSGYLLGIQW